MKKHIKLKKTKKTKIISKSSGKYRKRIKTRKPRKTIKKGGYNCELASIKEQGISIGDKGDIKGFSIPESRGVIYRPNCKTDSYHPMI